MTILARYMLIAHFDTSKARDAARGKVEHLLVRLDLARERFDELQGEFRRRTLHATSVQQFAEGVYPEIQPGRDLDQKFRAEFAGLVEDMGLPPWAGHQDFNHLVGLLESPWWGCNPTDEARDDFCCRPLGEEALEIQGRVRPYADWNPLKKAIEKIGATQVKWTCLPAHPQ